MRSQGAVASSDVRKGAIRFRKTADKSGGLGESGPRMEYEDLLKTSINASTSHDDIVVSSSQGTFYGASGNRCKFMVGESPKGINPMALAINIETEFTEKEIKSKKSWNENPMGVALTIESPSPPIPQQPIPQAEGRCPNNPFWTTRFPGAKERWYPVRVNGWGSLLNELAMSPLPPSDEGDARNDSGSFTNTWTKDFPYGGYYKVKMEVDDIGEFWIDDTKHIDLSRRRGKIREEKLIYIDGPTSSKEDPVSHDIKVVVENYKSQRTRTFDAKVFSTLDWISGGTSKSENKKVNFRITSASLFANGIKIPELGINVSKRYDGPNINQNFVRDVEVNRVYDVEFNSSKKGSMIQRDDGIKYEGLHAANNPITLTNNKRSVLLKDGHGNDSNATFSIDSGNVQFSDVGKRLIVKGDQAKFTLSWNDNPNTAGVAINSIRIGDKTWRRSGRSGSVTQSVKFVSGSAANVSNIGNIVLKNQGESVVLMEDHTDSSWDDIICGASEGRFFDFNGNKCRFVVGASTRVS